MVQAELAVILKFVLDHEDGLNLNEDLENFLQKGKLGSLPRMLSFLSWGLLGSRVVRKCSGDLPQHKRV